MKTILYALLSLLPLSSNGQLINGGFETWDSTYQNVYWFELSHIFGIADPLGGEIDHWVSSSGFGTSQTTDSYAGDYALILHNWYSYAREWVNYDEPLTEPPVSLTGYYKYDGSASQANPHGYANIALTRFNGTTNDTIAKADHIFDPVSSYTPFTVNLNYFSELNPDSIHIYIINSDRSCDTSIVCNFLYLDELRLSGGLSATNNIDRSVDLFKVYPIPTSDILYIEQQSDHAYQFKVFNSLGIEIESSLLSHQTEQINLSAYPAAVYYYTVISDHGQIDAGKILKL